MADAHGSGPCVRKDVGVQLPPRPLLKLQVKACLARLPGSLGNTYDNNERRNWPSLAFTARFMLDRIRETMRRDPLAGLLGGTVVADETWIGTNPKNRHASDERGRPGGGSTDKQPVLALVDYETREVRSVAVADVTGQTLGNIITVEVDVPARSIPIDSATCPARMTIFVP